MEDDIQCTTATISWDPVLHPDSRTCRTLYYEISIRPLDGGVITTDTSIDTTFSLTGLNPSTMYVITVVGINGAGDGESSNPLVITTMDEIFNDTSPNGELN